MNNAGSVVSPLRAVADAKRAVAGLDDDNDVSSESVASTSSMASSSDSDAEP